MDMRLGPAEATQCHVEPLHPEWIIKLYIFYKIQVKKLDGKSQCAFQDDKSGKR